MSIKPSTATPIQRPLSVAPEMLLQDPPFFEPISCDKPKHIKYKLNVSMLPQDEFHIFWGLKACEARVMAMALEFFTFHPRTPLSKQFKGTAIKCNNFLFAWCSFPKEYKDVCIRAAKTFNFHIERTKKIMVGVSGFPPLSSPEDYKKRTRTMVIPADDESVTFHIEFPQAHNILWFQAKDPMSDAMINALEAETVAMGNSLHKLGVD